MLRTAGVIALAILWTLNGEVVSGAGKKAGAARDAEMSAAVDKLAREVFAKADKNHNHFLSKYELSNAQAMLAAEADQWGRNGMIGKGAKPPAAGSNDAVKATPASKKTASSNRVSQAEFTLFAHSVVEQADQQWRTYHANLASQRELANAKRKNANIQRRTGQAARRGLGY